MNPESMGAGRIYKNGRSTAGWKRGKHVEELSELSDGTVIVSISHSFNAENLAIITKQRPQLPGVWANWVDVDGAVSDKDPFCIHGFMLQSKHRTQEEYFLAIPERHPSNETYRNLAIDKALHNEQRREFACSVLQDYETDQALNLHFNTNTKVILDEEGKGAYVTCSVWVPNPNYKEKEENDAAEA